MLMNQVRVWQHVLQPVLQPVLQHVLQCVLQCVLQSSSCQYPNSYAYGSDVGVRRYLFNLIFGIFFLNTSAHELEARRTGGFGVSLVYIFTYMCIYMYIHV